MKKLIELDRDAFKLVDSETGKLFVAQKSLLEKSKKYSQSVWKKLVGNKYS